MSVCRQQSQQASRTDNKNYDMCACQQIKLIYEKKTFYYSKQDNKKIVKYTENKLSTMQQFFVVTVHNLRNHDVRQRMLHLLLG